MRKTYLASFFQIDFFRHKLPIGLIFLTAAALFTYTALRAAIICMTHDESGSFLIWTDFDIFKCYRAADCWGTANLHWLYVLLMKLSIRLFGESELAIRLPSLLGHLVYLFFSWKLVKSCTTNPWLVLTGFLLLNLNPFLLEFFALARGYGLAVAWMMMSLYFFSRYLLTNRTAFVAGAFGGAFLAVLSNFTLLNFYACLLAVFAFMVGTKASVSVSKPDPSSHHVKFIPKFFQVLKNHLPALMAVLLITILLAWLIYRPIQFLMGKGEFEYGADSFWHTFKSLVSKSFYGKKYLSMYNIEYFGAGLVVVLLAATYRSVRQFLKNSTEGWSRVYLSACLLPLLASLAAIVQHHLLGSQYQTSRTALMFISLVALPVFLLFVDLLRQKISWWRFALPVLVAGFCVVHAFRAYQLKYSSEWWYDYQTKEMLLYLDEKLPEGKKIRLGLHWIYHPSSTFYFKTLPLDFAELPLIYDKNIRTDTLFDYYYVTGDDKIKLHPAYVLEKQFEYAGALMRRNKQ